MRAPITSVVKTVLSSSNMCSQYLGRTGCTTNTSMGGRMVEEENEGGKAESGINESEGRAAQPSGRKSRFRRRAHDGAGAFRRAHPLVDRLQFLAGLEAYRLAGRDGNFGAGARVAADSGLARPDVEHAKAPQLNAITLGQGALHAFKDGLYRQFGLGLGDAGLIDHFINDVELDHGRLPGNGVLQRTKSLMLRKISRIV